MDEENTTNEETETASAEKVVTPREEVEALTSLDQIKESREGLVAQVKGLQAKKGSGGLADADAILSLTKRIEAHDNAYMALKKADGVEFPDLEEIDEKIEAGFRKANKEKPKKEAPKKASKSDSAEDDKGEGSGGETETEETPAEAPAEETDGEEAAEEAPAEEEVAESTTQTVAEAKVPVAAGLSTVKVTKDGGQLRPFSMVAADNTEINTLQGFQAALGEAASKSSGSRTWVGSVNPYGPFDKSQMLTENAEANYGLLFGDNPRDSYKKASGQVPTDPNAPAFSAALNCAGPAQAVEEIPFDFTGGRPLQDSGLISLFPSVKNGQIQVYDCHELPEFPNLLQDADVCEPDGSTCADCGSYECAGYGCIKPGDPYTPDAYIQCMCVPEELQFSHPLVLERALADFAVASDKAWELKWLSQLRELSILRTIDGAAAPEHGGFNTILRTFMAAKSRLALDGRSSGGLSDYEAFIPGGEAVFCAAMADKMSRVLGCECPGEDILQMIQDKFDVPINFGLDQDPNGAQVAEGITEVWANGSAVNDPQPMEDIVNAGTVYMIPRDTLVTASPLSYQYGFETRTKCETGSGCMKLLRREWWFDLIKIGCRTPIAFDFKALGTCGTGPDLTPCS